MLPTRLIHNRDVIRDGCIRAIHRQKLASLFQRFVCAGLFENLQRCDAGTIASGFAAKSFSSLVNQADRAKSFPSDHVARRRRRREGRRDHFCQDR